MGKKNTRVKKWRIEKNTEEKKKRTLEKAIRLHLALRPSHPTWGVAPPHPPFAPAYPRPPYLPVIGSIIIKGIIVVILRE